MGVTALPQCAGFGRHEGDCQQLADTPARIWCARCEKLRRKHITGQMAKVTEAFRGAS